MIYYDPLCLYMYNISLQQPNDYHSISCAFLHYLQLCHAKIFPPFGPHTGHSVPCRLETSEGHPGYDLPVDSGTGNQPEVQNRVR